jgi:hypothetical protein
MAQLEAIRHEMRTGLSILNPGPMTRQVMDSAAPGLLNPVEIKETGDCAVARDTAHLFSDFFHIAIAATNQSHLHCFALFTLMQANVCHCLN